MTAACALAEFDAAAASAWLERFAGEIAGIPASNDVLSTADPARAGEYLLEYHFGTVTAKTPQAPSAQEIVRVELTDAGAYDCRGLSVGQTLEDVIAGRQITASDTPLYVLSTQEYGYGWSWAYVGDQGVYGVEYISYGGEENALKEYTLTYVIEEETITSIRLKIAEATLAQAQEGLRTAEEIAGRQQGEVIASENESSAFEEADMTRAYRRAVGVPVESLIALIGEPQEIQTLPSGTGRMLVYSFCAAELVFDEMTGVEIVRSISCAAMDIAGPRGVAVGMPIEQAAARFRCDGEVYSTGGALYLAGEAQGIAPYGELIRDGAAQYTLRYACETAGGRTGYFEAAAADGVVRHWRIYIEEAEAAYGG